MDSFPPFPAKRLWNLSSTHTSGQLAEMWRSQTRPPIVGQHVHIPHIQPLCGVACIHGWAFLDGLCLVRGFLRIELWMFRALAYTSVVLMSISNIQRALRWLPQSRVRQSKVPTISASHMSALVG